MNQRNNVRNSKCLLLILYTFNILSGLGNCTPVANEDNSVSREMKGNGEEWDVDPKLLALPDFEGEARIFGNFSFGNNSILTVAGFVIVGIILFGKIITFYSF